MQKQLTIATSWVSMIWELGALLVDGPGSDSSMERSGACPDLIIDFVDFVAAVFLIAAGKFVAGFFLAAAIFFEAEVFGACGTWKISP